MLEILSRSIAHAGGIEVPADVRITGGSVGRRSLLARMIAAFERWNVRRSTYLTLKQLDDHMLADIGLHRGMLYDLADKIGGLAAANDNELPTALSRLPANDNAAKACADCV